MKSIMISIFALISAKSFQLKNTVNNFVSDERGDTNFISIIIILAIVVVVAGLFISSADKIVGAVKGTIDTFTGSVGSDIQGIGG